MTTNNHPANGPVSLERLHQIRQYIERNNQYQNGGNRAYILADMLKVIDGAIASFGVEPVAYTEKCEITNMQATGLYLRGFPDNSQGRNIALYTEPPAPERHAISTDLDEGFEKWYTAEACGEVTVAPEWFSEALKPVFLGTWRACRAAMLQAGNSPVTPDGWVMVPKEMTDAIGEAIARHANCCGGIALDIYDAMLAAAPQQ